MAKDKFTIIVDQKEYFAEEVSSAYTRSFRIEKGCNYLYTIHQTEFNGWMIDDLEVVSIDEYLPERLGDAIEKRLNGPSVV